MVSSNISYTQAPERTNAPQRKYVRISETRLENLVNRVKFTFIFCLIVASLGAAVIGFFVGRAFPYNSVDYDLVATYTMRTGDTVWEVASSIENNPYSLKETVEEILDMNNIYAPEKIQAGTEIIIPQW